jgi:hypothetical protein
MKERIIISLLAIFAFVSQALGQYDAVIDEVIGVVGESVILKSDLEKEYSQMRLQYPAYEGNLRCELLSQLVTQNSCFTKPSWTASKLQTNNWNMRSTEE